MATLKLSFIKNVKNPWTTYTDHEVVKTISVVGRKHNNPEVSFQYLCHKNPYGIVWVSKIGSYCDVCVDPKWVKAEHDGVKPLPQALPTKYDSIIVNIL